MSNFDTAYENTNAHEGGFANHPNDRGGMTYRGIARNSWPAWEGWSWIDENQGPVGIREALDASHRKFFRENFWEPLYGDRLPGEASIKLYDTAVNVGIHRAVTWLQWALNLHGAKLTEDGIIGPKTLKAVEQLEHKLDEIMQSYRQRQAHYYIFLAGRDESQEVFLKGWLKRAAA